MVYVEGTSYEPGGLCRGHVMYQVVSESTIMTRWFT